MLRAERFKKKREQAKRREDRGYGAREVKTRVEMTRTTSKDQG